MAITLSDGRKITPETNDSLITPIELPRVGDSFADIGMLVPTNINKIAMNTLIGAPYNYWGDDDGDGQGSNNISATGDLTLTIVDKNNKSVPRNEIPTICNSPYKLSLSSSAGYLTTRYGFPNRSSFSTGSVNYYINPKASPSVCFAKPNLKYGGEKDRVNGDIVDYRGPEWMWNTYKGFLTQSATPSSYHLNFPTTGADHLYFDLDIGGYNGPLTWPPVTRSGITATMRPNSNNTSVRVTLTGPVASTSQWNTIFPNRITQPDLPQTFELVGKDSNGKEVVKYGFVLRQWFVQRGIDSSYFQASSWCKNIGYRLAQVKDLTNASCQGTLSDDRCVGAVGATPSSPNNRYQRTINAGFFSEWGFMTYYVGANFSNTFYWTVDLQSSRTGFVVYSDDADVHRRDITTKTLAVCVTP